VISNSQMADSRRRMTDDSKSQRSEVRGQRSAKSEDLQ
jgi:hypothetical protein